MINLKPKRENGEIISVIPNGVDLNYFSPNENLARERATLVFSGKMSYHANITMVLYLIREIMPIIWTERPDVKLWIVGKDPPREILNLGDQPNITVTGFVEDIRPFLQRATVAVVPLQYGAGSQVKVLEAMACETPVVVTSKAVSALSVVDGEEILVANDPEDFSKSVLKLLNIPNYRYKISQYGRKYVEENHNWESIVTQLEGIYHEVTNDKYEYNS
jgi:glycosyltransferase involved in cell wall biosynthesis